MLSSSSRTDMWGAAGVAALAGVAAGALLHHVLVSASAAAAPVAAAPSVSAVSEVRSAAAAGGAPRASAAAAASSASAPRPGPVIVGVAGASGSGKTSIAGLVASRLRGGRVLSISCDSYYHTLPADADSAEYNFDHPRALDLELLGAHLAALRAGEDVEVPQYDFATHRRLAATTRVCARDTAVILLDGIFVLWADCVARHCDINVFCSEDLDVCLVRRLRRDMAERQRSSDSVLHQYLRFVKAGFHEFVAPSMAKADLIVPRARENAVAIDMLARELQRRIDAAAACAEDAATAATVAVGAA